MGVKVEQRGCEAGGEIAGGNTAERWELGAGSAAEACGMSGVAGKCIDIEQNPDCEGSVPGRH